MATKLDRLNMLRSALLECKKRSVEDAEEWQVYDDMMTRVKGLIADEGHRIGCMAVYPVEDGQAGETLFTGTQEQCDTYVSILLEGRPEMKGSIVIANL